MTTMLSCNLNKVALIRNSRDGNTPDLLTAAHIVIEAGAGGLTLHPRADGRHARLSDVAAFARLEPVRSGRIELNIEGDLRPDLIEATLAAGAHQFTVVPVQPGEKTSNRGWCRSDDQALLVETVRKFQPKTRVAVFVESDPAAVELVAASGAKAVEFYTGPYAADYGTKAGDEELARLVAAADTARNLGLRINAGHDLTTDNLGTLVRAIRPAELSIGHALTADALWYGLGEAVKRYLQAIAEA